MLVQDGGHVTFSQVSLAGNRAIGGSGRSGTSRTGNGAPGKAAEGGGLFLSTGTINLTASKLFGNTAVAGAGGNGYAVQCTCTTPTCTMKTCPGHSGKGGAGGAGAGGGLYVLSGKVGLSTSTVSGNNASGAGGGGGGGFFGPTTDGCCVVGGNGGAGQGAGLFIAVGALSLGQTTVSGNSAAGGNGGFGGATNFQPGRASGGSSRGAGMFVASGNINLSNSTFFADTAIGGHGGDTRFGAFGPGGDAAGGGLYLGNASVSLKGVTLASNQALGNRAFTFSGEAPGSSSGGGIANVSAGLFINTTLIGNNSQNAGNPSNGNDVSGPITSSYSLIGQIAGATIIDNGRNIFNAKSCVGS